MSYWKQHTAPTRSCTKQQTLNKTNDNDDGTPVLSEKEAREALNGFTDDELQDGILWDTPEDVAGIILEG